MKRTILFIAMFMAIMAHISANPSIPMLIEDYQVIQRDGDDRGVCIVKLPDFGASAIRITDVSGKVVADVRTSECELNGNAKGVLIENIPVGGPYTIEIGSESAFHNIMVGDIWVTGGQSNMFGHSMPVEEQPAVPGVSLYDTQRTGMEAHWCAAIPPFHRNPQDKGRTEFKKYGGLIGPAESFVRKLYEDSGVPIGLIPCAITSNLSMWYPDHRDTNRYGFLYHHVMKAGGRIKGLLWAQGEGDVGSDKLDPTCTAPGQTKPISAYAAEFIKFTEALRRDFNNPNLIIISAQACRHYEPMRYALTGYDDIRQAKKQNNRVAGGHTWEWLREVQRQVAEDVPNMHVVPMVDLEMQDIGHLDYASYKRLGWRMAWVALPYVKKGVPARSEIKLKSVRWIKGKTFPQHMAGSDSLMIEVQFEGVTGKLTAPGRPTGFQLRSPNKKFGEGEDWIVKVAFDPERPNVVILYAAPWEDKPDHRSVLYYGPGVAPYVNITDENDMAVPAFGPIRIEGSAAR